MSLLCWINVSVLVHQTLSILPLSICVISIFFFFALRQILIKQVNALVTSKAVLKFVRYQELTMPNGKTHKYTNHTLPPTRRLLSSCRSNIFLQNPPSSVQLPYEKTDKKMRAFNNLPKHHCFLKMQAKSV